MRGLKNKVALVTGGVSGIGRACVERLCDEGALVAFSDLNTAGSEFSKELNARGYQTLFVKGDMADDNVCKKLADEAGAKWGKIHFIVNNAFSFLSKGPDVSRDDWNRVMHAGPVAYAAVVQHALKYMTEGGAVVNMSSISAHIAQPNRWTYNAAKGAVTQLTKCMAMDLAPKIRVNAISPAWTWTPEVSKAANGNKAKWEPVWGKFHLLRRLCSAEEIAGPVAFLLSDEASFITGSDLFVDGGYLTMGSEGLGENSSFVGSA